MSFYHISAPLNRHQPKINSRSAGFKRSRLRKVLSHTKRSAPTGSIVRPVYSDEEQLVGYITVPLTEWASTLIL